MMINSRVQAFQYECAAHMLYDATMRGCNWEQAVDPATCNAPSVERGPPSVPPFHGDTDTLLLVTEPSVAPVVVDIVEFDCPADGSFPDMESGCESYFVCAGGNVSR